MKRLHLSLAACSAAMVWGTVACAEPGDVFVLGYGTSSCGELIAGLGDLPPGKFRKQNTGNGGFVSQNKAHQEWLMGFVSGFNSAHDANPEQQVTKIDPAGLDLWMRNWCNKHPMQSIFDGAAALIDEIRAKR